MSAEEERALNYRLAVEVAGYAPGAVLGLRSAEAPDMVLLRAAGGVIVQWRPLARWDQLGPLIAQRVGAVGGALVGSVVVARLRGEPFNDADVRRVVAEALLGDER